jgi:uncharacterized membrane protein
LNPLKLELRISKLLRVGVLLSGAFMFVGWMAQLSNDPHPFSAFAHYQRVPLADSLENALLTQNWGMPVSYLGLFFLVALPSVRVFLTAILFLKQKEYRLAAIAFFVLLALGLSFSLGIESH